MAPSKNRHAWSEGEYSLWFDRKRTTPSVQTIMVFGIAIVSWLLLSCSNLLAAEGKRLPATASAQISAPGYGPELAVDNNDRTVWAASLTPQKSNNSVWFQLDLGSVKQVARLHWLAAAGTPYPASAPNKYRVAVSGNGVSWTTVHDATNQAADEPAGNIVLNTTARYVRLQTTQVHDGSGWSLGLREIWVTEGYDDAAASLQWHLHSTMQDGHIRLTWQAPNDRRIKYQHVCRTAAPTDEHGVSIATIGASDKTYTDQVPNWTPYYYYLQAFDSNGKVIGRSATVAAFAHPENNASGRTETFAFWYEAYKPTSDPDSSARHIGHADFVVGPGPGAIPDLNKYGVGSLPYITLYQTADWTPKTFQTGEDYKSVVEKIAPIAFYNESLDFAGSPPGYAPTEFGRPGNVEYNPKSIQYVTCPNSTVFRDMVLTKVKNLLAGGASGFFVDNGYQDKAVASLTCHSTSHKHYYGNELTSADAFLGMLMEITCAVKKKNPRGIIIVNGIVPADAEFYGLKLGDVSDGILWESYLRSSYATPKEHAYDWETVYKRSVDLEKAWQSSPPRRMFVLSYPWNRDEAFFCYATAKLCDLPWSAGLGVSDPDHKKFGGHFGTYPELVDIRLGAPSDTNQFGGEKLGDVYVRTYEKGFVVVNPTHQEQQLELPLTGHRSCYDSFARKNLTDGNLRVALPPESGRVYLYQ
jgi:hypothetical protein